MRRLYWIIRVGSKCHPCALITGRWREDTQTGGHVTVGQKWERLQAKKRCSSFSAAWLAQVANSGIGSTKDLGGVSLTSFLHKSFPIFLLAEQEFSLGFIREPLTFCTPWTLGTRCDCDPLGLVGQGYVCGAFHSSSDIQSSVSTLHVKDWISN